MKRILAFTMALLILTGSMFVVSYSEGTADRFYDVPADSWFYNAVNYVCSAGLFSGTSDTTFSPNNSMTRGMLAAVLAKLSGDDTKGYSTDSFTDVKPEHWFYNAAAWAQSKGIMNGTTADTFSPDQTITRQEICLALYRFTEVYGLGIKPLEAEKFNDDAKIALWAKDAVYSMRYYGVVSGSDGNNFDPRLEATRAQVAVILMKFDSEINKYKAPELIKPVISELKVGDDDTSISILAVSDTHISLASESDEQAVRDFMETRTILFGKESEDDYSSYHRFPVLLDYAKQTKVDLLALTGDIVDCPSKGNVDFLLDKMSKYDGEYMFALGNHDWTYPEGILSSTYMDNEQKKNIELFKPLYKEEEQEDTSIIVREINGYTVVSLDNSSGEVDSNQYITLKKLCEKGKKIILHVPIGSDIIYDDMVAMWGVDTSMSYDTAKNNPTKLMLDLLYGKDSTVVAIISGHVHFYSEGKISGENDTIQYTTETANKNGGCRIINIHG